MYPGKEKTLLKIIQNSWKYYIWRAVTRQVFGVAKKADSENEDHGITSWEIDGETVETVSDFILWCSKITADGDCSHEIKRHLLLGQKVMTNLDSILKSRDNTLPTKVYLVKAMVFPVVMYGCESWTIKKAESQRIDALELCYWKTLESPLDCKEI